MSELDTRQIMALRDLEELYAFLKITNLNDAKRSITGLRERVLFTSDYEAQEAQLQRFYDLTTTLISWAPTGRVDLGATQDYHDAFLALTQFRDELRRTSAVIHDESHWQHRTDVDRLAYLPLSKNMLEQIADGIEAFIVAGASDLIEIWGPAINACRAAAQGAAERGELTYEFHKNGVCYSMSCPMDTKLDAQIAARVIQGLIRIMDDQ